MITKKISENSTKIIGIQQEKPGIMKAAGSSEYDSDWLLRKSPSPPVARSRHYTSLENVSVNYNNKQPK